MCTLVILRRPGHAWPVLLAANRDELVSRPSRPPGRHWPDRPHVTAGLDEQAGGTWLGVNEDGLSAAILNRRGSLGPAPGKRSRGELVLEALDHAEAYIAAEALSGLDPAAYRPFNLVIADPIDAFWLRHDGHGPIRAHPVPEGLSLIESGELNDPESPRTRRFLPRFRTAAAPEPAQGEWAAWMALLGEGGDGGGDGGDADGRDAMCIRTAGEYGTRSGSLLALPAYAHEQPVWLYADGPPDEAAFAAVAI